MNIRRTSGEIVNATLLETFLALVFLVLALAVFESQRADKAATRRSDSVLSERARNLAQLNDSLRGVLLSKYPPDCDSHAQPVEWLTVTLVGPNRLHVIVNRSEFGLAAGSMLDLSRDEFVGRFDSVRVDGERRRCRYVVRIQDTNGTDKMEFKRAVSAVNIDFRPTGYLR
jgi:hypothetical protein